ncbi:NUDIX domain-containing protein [Sphingomonas sp. R86521]|uniref:NUDIX domain-containing protein n=1 Tax=Sphingomonas sp. R86521 TaxID=3093860 RepID=UPI0036D36777
MPKRYFQTVDLHREPLALWRTDAAPVVTSARARPRPRPACFAFPVRTQKWPFAGQALWATPGEVDEGESGADVARRELFEEFGL